MCHLLVKSPSKSEKIFLNEQASIWLAGGVFYHGQGRVLTAPSKAGVRVGSWGFVIGVQDCFATGSPGRGGLEDAPSGFCSYVSLAPAPLEIT